MALTSQISTSLLQVDGRMTEGGVIEIVPGARLLLDVGVEDIEPGALLDEIATAVAEAQAARDEAVDISGISTSDGVIANRITTPGSETQVALSATYATVTALGTKADASALAAKVDTAALPAAVAAEGAREFATNQGVYLPTPMAGRKWRRKRAAVLAGLERAHVAFMGDSIPYGAAATGNTPPKNVTSYPGRFRAMLEQAGLYGGGLTIANAAIRANPTWDTRWTFGGTVTDQAFGFHKAACFRINGSSAANYIEFTEYCDEFVVYNTSATSGYVNASIDGGATFIIRNVASGGAAPAYEKEAGYAPSQIVTRIPAGSLGTHTLKLWGVGDGLGTRDVFLLGIKHVISGDGKIEVSNPSISSKGMNTLWSGAASNDEVNGLYGLPMVDMLRADLLVAALGINDWQGSRTLAAAQADLATLVARQTTSGNAPTGGAKANGDIALLWNPQPDISTLGTSSPQTWAQWRDGWYDAADAGGCPLIDLGDRWVDYATGVAAGYLADVIHPTDAGALDIVAAAHEAVMHRI